jgi:ribose transport system substrate-binding protein
MMIGSRRGLLALLAAAVLSSGACRRAPSGAGAPRPTIAVVPKGSTHEHWKTVHAGAIKAARERGADILWKAPIREDDRKGQIDIVESLVARRVAGICLAPLDDRALGGAVRAAGAAGIPVVIMDSGLQGGGYASFVATDNYAGGTLAGERLAERLHGHGRVVLFRYSEGSDSTGRREQGCADAIAKHPGIQIVSDNQYAGATVETAFKNAENLLAAQKAASGGVDGMFAPNESSTFGVLLALRKSGLGGKIRLVGFDRSEKLVEGLRNGEIDGLVVQNPFEMGYRSVATMLDHLAGKPIPARIDTGATLVTRDNLGNPQIARLVRPDLTEWLGKE